MPHEFKLTGSYYTSKSGNNGNAGTDPNLPKLTIASMLASGSGIVGTGVYEENNLAIQSRSIQADGLVVIKNPGGSDPALGTVSASTIEVVDGFIFTGFSSVFDWSAGSNKHRGNTIKNCIINGGVFIFSYTTSELSFEGLFSNNKIVNCSATFTGLGSSENTIPGQYGIDGSIFVSSTIAFTTLSHVIYNLQIGPNCTLSLPSDTAAEKISHSNIQCPITINGTTYANLAAAKAAFPSTFPNCTNLDPLFIGDPLKLEFVVQPNSPLVASGQLGFNIGNVRTGSLQNSTSLQWGLSPETNTNTQFNSNGALEVSPSFTTGNRKSKEIDLGQVVRSPTIRYNGLFDGLNNVPDSNNALVNPNHLTINISYAGLDKVYTAEKPFRYNEKIQLDTTGKSNGEAGFDWSNLVDTEFRYIKINPDVRNNYTVA